MLLKKIISYFFAYTLLTASLTIQSMDTSETSKPKNKKPSKAKRLQNWVATAGNIILGKTPPQEMEQFTPKKTLTMEETPFGKLPTEIQSVIIDALKTTSEAKNLTQAMQAIKTLASTSQQLNKIINDPTFCLNLIKRYAKAFEINDATVCNMLSTQGAKTRLTIQYSLINDICTNFTPNSILLFDELIAEGIDPYFTDFYDNTPAELCIQNYNVKGLIMLLALGVDPEFVGKNGMSLYDLAASRPNREHAHSMLRALNRAIDEKYEK